MHIVLTRVRIGAGITPIKANYPPLLNDFSKTKGGDSYKSEISKTKNQAAPAAGLEAKISRIILHSSEKSYVLAQRNSIIRAKCGVCPLGFGGEAPEKKILDI